MIEAGKLLPFDLARSAIRFCALYERATGFEVHLAIQTGARSQASLSKSTQLRAFAALWAFSVRLTVRQGYKLKIGYADAEESGRCLQDTIDTALAEAGQGGGKGRPSNGCGTGARHDAGRHPIALPAATPISSKSMRCIRA